MHAEYNKALAIVASTSHRIAASDDAFETAGQSSLIMWPLCCPHYPSPLFGTWQSPLLFFWAVPDMATSPCHCRPQLAINWALIMSWPPVNLQSLLDLLQLTSPATLPLPLPSSATAFKFAVAADPSHMWIANKWRECEHFMQCN